VISDMKAVISGTNAADRSQLVEQLARRVDVNRDGQVTSAEFSSFLSGLMKSIDEESTARPSTPVAGETPASDSSPVLVSVADAGQLTRAQGAQLLRQALSSVSRAR
jgi:hypothetical protein